MGFRCFGFGVADQIYRRGALFQFKVAALEFDILDAFKAVQGVQLDFPSELPALVMIGRG
jgi:hypothetical protein